MKQLLFSYIIILFFTSFHKAGQVSWIRINQLGYTPKGIKVAVWCSKEQQAIDNWQLVDAATNNTVYSGKAGKAFGAYGPFTLTYRLNFSSFTQSGNYYVQAGNARSPEFRIADDVYKGAADFCLRYMRQQRSGFNPFLRDSCHTHDGYVLYGEKAGIRDSTHIDVVGGWHDASDYLQYSSTSANATYHLLMAYRDFKNVFPDNKLANGLDGKNEMSDVLDEAKWGLDWLLKMHPKDDWLFNQVADDRDHHGMRIPKEDSFYGRGYERPVYFCSGQPQGFGKYKNRSTGVASAAGKFASALALGYDLLGGKTKEYRGSKSEDFIDTLYRRAISAYQMGMNQPGICQTAPGKSPYFYEEDNWTDDMELAGAVIYQLKGSSNRMDNYLKDAYEYAKKEKITPWLGADTARHYQWYPFINIGHYELAKQLTGEEKNEIISYYKEGIERVWQKAKQNAFYRGVPFIWCINN